MLKQSPAACPEGLKQIAYVSSLVLDSPNSRDAFAIISFKFVS
jgi:hypothetical protein